MHTRDLWRRSALGFLWKGWCWIWNSSTLATSCEELTHWNRLWFWEGLGAGGEGDGRGWDGWMASLTDGYEPEWTPGVGDGQGGLACCDPWGRKELDTTERLNWTELNARVNWGIGAGEGVANFSLIWTVTVADFQPLTMKCFLLLPKDACMPCTAQVATLNICITALSYP